jgi:hypothetical protein
MINKELNVPPNELELILHPLTGCGLVEKEDGGSDVSDRYCHSWDSRPLVLDEDIAAESSVFVL